MHIADLSEEHRQSYFWCLEDWSDEIKEAGNHKELWYEKMKDKGLRVKLALDDNGVVAGMIQYIPIEYSTAEGKNLYFIQCIWIHGYKKGRGNFQKRGFGKALLQAAEEDAKVLGAKGMVAWGISLLPVFMRASWFRKHGYKKVDSNHLTALLWKPFSSDAIAPQWIKPKKKPAVAPGRVTVTCFYNGWCPAMNLTLERAKRAVDEYGDKVIFNEINTVDRNTFLEWGISDALFVNTKEIRTGPPPSFEKIQKKIAKQVNKTGK
jgi:N-acetylglutamate synthase-like GNAT family acetyltransferase